MRIQPEYLILGSMVTGGIALTVAGVRTFASYLDSILLNTPGSPPPGLFPMILGAAMLGFSLGYVSGEWKQIKEGM